MMKEKKLDEILQHTEVVWIKVTVYLCETVNVDGADLQVAERALHLV